MNRKEEIKKQTVTINNQTYVIEERPFANKKAGSFIKEQRVKNNLTIEELAKKLDFTVPYLEMVEKGKKQLSLNSCIKVCKVLKLSIMDFSSYIENVEKKILLKKND